MKRMLLAIGCLGAFTLPAVAQPYTQRYSPWTDRSIGHNRRVIRPYVNPGYNGTYRTYTNPYLNYGNPYNAPYTTYPNGYYGSGVNPYNWSALDLNHNGVLESYELQRQGYYSGYNYNMNTYDLNHDGYIDSYEASRMNGYGSAGAGILNFLLQVAPGLVR